MRRSFRAVHDYFISCAIKIQPQYQRVIVLRVIVLIVSHEKLSRSEKSTLYDTDLERTISTIYNMSGRVVSDIQTRAEGESLYIRYNTDANVVNDLKNDSSYEFIGEVILKINVV